MSLSLEALLPLGIAILKLLALEESYFEGLLPQLPTGDTYVNALAPLRLLIKRGCPVPLYLVPCVRLTWT